MNSLVRMFLRQPWSMLPILLRMIGWLDYMSKPMWINSLLNPTKFLVLVTCNIGKWFDSAQDGV